MGRLLGIDYGEKRVGVSISDPTGTIAFPLETLETKSVVDLLEQIKNIVVSENVEEIVIGLPIGMKGQETLQTQEVYRFIKVIQKKFEIPVHMADERLSSVSAEFSLREQGIPPSKNKAMIDSRAAAIILQGYLDRVKG